MPNEIYMTDPECPYCKHSDSFYVLYLCQAKALAEKYNNPEPDEAEAKCVKCQKSFLIKEHKFYETKKI